MYVSELRQRGKEGSERVEDVHVLCSAVAQVTWTKGGKLRGTKILLILHVH